MDGEVMANSGVAVDTNVVNIVNALNEIAGVETISSSRGDGEIGSREASSKSFAVSMNVRQDQIGWLAIATIQLAIDVLDLPSANGLRLTVCMDAVGDQTYILCLKLSGIGIHLDRLAESIRNVGELAVIKCRGINRAYIIGEVFEPAWT